MHYHQNIQHQIYFHVYVLSIISFILELYSPIDFHFEKGVSVKYILCFVIHFYYFFQLLSTYCVLVCLQALGSQKTGNREPRALPKEFSPTAETDIAVFQSEILSSLYSIKM